MKNIVVVLIALFSVLTGKTQVLEQDSLALVAIFNNTNGTNWYSNHGWLNNNYPVGEWEGVTIRSNRVVRLAVGFNNLSGNIPAEIGDLDSLSFLDLSASTILSIPESFGNLTSLDTLGFFTSLIDTLPPCIGSLTDLELFDFSFTQIRYLPDEIGNLINLKHLLGYDADLQSLPETLGNMTSLISIDFGLNNISNLPASIGNCTNLTKLWLNANNIPVIPETIGNLTQLTELVLGGNEMTELPISIFNLTELKVLNFAAANLSTIPAEIGNLINLENFQFFENEFTVIPYEIGNCTKLNYINGYSNKIESLPLSLLNLQEVGTLFLGYNSLTFGDIEPLVSIDGFGYNHQDSIGEKIDTTVLINTAFRLEIITDGAFNQYQWLKNGEPLMGATDFYLEFQNLTYSDSGIYHCEVTNSLATGLTLFSRPVRINVSDIVNTDESYNEYVNLEIYPNPAVERVMFSYSGTNSPGNLELSLFDAQGALILKHMLKNENHSIIDCSDLKSGMYFVQLSDTSNGKKSPMKKLIVL
jgi:Leucine-rich repeat (LRR) protein